MHTFLGTVYQVDERWWEQSVTASYTTASFGQYMGRVFLFMLWPLINKFSSEEINIDDDNREVQVLLTMNFHPNPVLMELVLSADCVRYRERTDINCDNDWTYIFQEELVAYFYKALEYLRSKCANRNHMWIDDVFRTVSHLPSLSLLAKVKVPLKAGQSFLRRYLSCPRVIQRGEETTCEEEIQKVCSADVLFSKTPIEERRNFVRDNFYMGIYPFVQQVEQCYRWSMNLQLLPRILAMEAFYFPNQRRKFHTDNQLANVSVKIEGFCFNVSRELVHWAPCKLLRAMAVETHNLTPWKEVPSARCYHVGFSLFDQHMGSTIRKHFIPPIRTPKTLQILALAKFTQKMVLAQAWKVSDMKNMSVEISPTTIIQGAEFNLWVEKFCSEILEAAKDFLEKTFHKIPLESQDRYLEQHYKLCETVQTYQARSDMDFLLLASAIIRHCPSLVHLSPYIASSFKRTSVLDWGFW